MDEALVWLRANKHDLGALTGTDTRVLLAVGQCWILYVASGDVGRVIAMRAIANLLRAMQPKSWRFAKAVIPWAMDWSDEDPVWAALQHEAGQIGIPIPLGGAL